MTNPSRHPVAFDFFVEIAVIDQLVGAEMARVLPDGVSMASFSLLNHLLSKGGSDSPARLAQALQVTKGTITCEVFSRICFKISVFVALVIPPNCACN